MIYNKIGFVACLAFVCLSANAQPGIYSEDDISLHTLFMDAQTAKYQDKFEEQIDLLKQLLELDRTCTACHYELAMAYSNLEDYSKASSSIKKAIAKQPNNYGYNQLAKTIYNKTNNFDDALSILNRLIEQNPYDRILREEFVELAIKNKDHQTAINALEELDVRFGVYERSTMWKLEIYEAKKDKQGQIESVLKLIQAYPENTRYLNNLASMYLEFGDEKKAQETWNRILEIDPNDPSANYALLVESSENGKAENGLTALIPMIENRSVSLDDKIKELIPHISNIQVGSNGEQNDQLMNLANKLVGMYPKEAKAYAVRADVHHYIGDFASANKDYIKTTDLNKGILQVWEQRMNNEIQMEDFESLLKTSKGAIDYFPLQFSPYFYNAFAMIKTGKTEKLKMQIQEARFVAAKDESSILRLAYLDAMQSFLADDLEATKSFVNAYANTKIKDYLVHELIGDIFAKKGDIKSALQSWAYSKKLGNHSTTLIKKISEEKYIN